MRTGATRLPLSKRVCTLPVRFDRDRSARKGPLIQPLVARVLLVRGRSERRWWKRVVIERLVT
jgi:hypothetical protein